MPTNDDNCGGLSQLVILTVGAKVLLWQNIATEDGLVKGATGFVTGFDWAPAVEHLPIPERGMPGNSTRMVQFDTAYIN
jgi:hypothetical protein